ncbi:glycoside hydrolase family 18 protein [Acrodontium crateriforme]|uniref:chitinase n=1 Tax=Acrodontium crateriforme TaxID=150365 RepID=A0AAQ3R5Q7_9PEZI|nr:glycoside hydrolase family 18 protein [Acrodontium crateriforme]
MPRFTRLAGTAILVGSVRAFQSQLKNYDSTSSMDASSAGNVAVYWGQNSYGQANGNLAQQPLATYCADSNIDIIPMAFLYQLTTGTGGQPVINFANQQNNCTLFDGTETLNCPDIGKDITTCQEKYNKTILLSVGGATYTEGGFTSSDLAESNAEHIWATFGPKSSSSKRKRDNSTILRPFGDASIDGFDIDLESTNQNFDVWTKKMRSLMDADSSKKYWLTAAPQCVYPDAADKSMLNGGIPFDAVWVQFYNNGCGLQSFVAGAKNQTNFNFDVWDNWASTTSANKDVKVYIGVPAGQTGAGRF